MVRKNAINKYILPVPKHRLQRIDKTSSPAHVGNLRNAIDFIVDEETPVLAAADGIVTFVKDMSIKCDVCQSITSVNIVVTNDNK